MVLFCAASTCAELNQQDNWGAALGYGESKDGTHIYRVALQYEFPWQWFENRTGRLTGFHEASAGFWYRHSDSLAALMYSPVFTYRINVSRHFEPYLEGGIGIGLLTEENINGRDMSSHFQFEDRIGIGVRFGSKRRHDLNFRYLHYSNAGFTLPNHGIDIYMLSYAVSL
jgi:lipid A 3-O-deacylase